MHLCLLVFTNIIFRSLYRRNFFEVQMREYVTNPKAKSTIKVVTEKHGDTLRSRNGSIIRS